MFANAKSNISTTTLSIDTFQGVIELYHKLNIYMSRQSHFNIKYFFIIMWHHVLYVRKENQNNVTFHTTYLNKQNSWPTFHSALALITVQFFLIYIHHTDTIAPFW